jgi:hypothetical protein
MAFTMNTSGMGELAKRLGELGVKAQEIASLSLYEGAGVMADSVSQAVHGIATEPFRYGTTANRRKPSPEEKAILENARKGVAKFRKSVDRVDTSVGMQNSGYADLKGKTVPVPLIANAINSGTSFMQKQPFMRKAKHQEKAAVAKIESELEKRLDELSLD